MSRGARGSGRYVLALCAAGWVWQTGAGLASEDQRTIPRFLQQLKARGLHDVALDYLNQLRGDANLSGDLKALLDYEEGRTLIDEAARSSDVVLREELLRDARDKLDGFVKHNPKRPEARDALVQLAKLLVERGYLAMDLSEDMQDKSKKDAKVAEARDSFTQAHDAYARSVEALGAAYKTFPVSLPEGDPRRTDRDAVYATLLDAMLQKGVADYELAQTYSPDSPDRAKHLKSALEQFDALYKNYREQFAGLTAQMWQAKCYEEQGEIGAAIGLYKQLLQHTDPRLRALQRHVGYFYIVALAKRKQHALAADEASRWLEKYSGRDEQRSRPGLGVLLELAKAIDAQMPEIASLDRPKAARRIIDTASQVVRYASPFKNDALALLKKYKPGAAIRASEIDRLSYEDAMGRADEAIAAHEWDRAIALLRAAARKADPIRELEKVNRARYNLAFCYYMTKRFYEAFVLSDHLAIRYPKGGLSAKGTAIGMQALADAYNTYTEFDRLSDIERLIGLAAYTAETWPERDEGDDARLNLGLIYVGRGEYDRAIAVLEAIRRRSNKWTDAQTRLGGAHWGKSRLLDRRGDATGAALESKKAFDILNATLKARQDAGATATDPGLIGNVGDLAIVLTESGKPADALKLLEPIVRAQHVRSGPAFSRLMEAQLTALIATSQVEQAIATMRTLEQAGGAGNLTQLYLKLGKLLERELESLREKGNTAAFARVHQAYKTFLTTLAERKTGQTYESLEWAGERLIALDAYKEAEETLTRVLKTFSEDPQFMQQKDGRNSLLRTRIRLAEAFRGQGKLDLAGSLVEELIAQNPRIIDPLFEKGMLLEAEAEARRGEWTAALRHWQNLVRKVEPLRPRPMVYYDIWYHVAWVLYQQRETQKARQTLQGVMRLAPRVGGPEMKAKYDGMIARLSKN
jgi:tetratricopeptide (TPR) repeat protein